VAPEFLPAVPLDDFSGKPFHYVPEKKLLYSVGPDLRDSGGQRSYPQFDDLSFPIEF
jgi:hypothetical protein